MPTSANARISGSPVCAGLSAMAASRRAGSPGLSADELEISKFPCHWVLPEVPLTTHLSPPEKRTALLNLDDRYPPRLVEEHVLSMDLDYFHEFSPTEIEGHLRRIATLAGEERFDFDFAPPLDAHACVRGVDGTLRTRQFSGPNGLEWIEEKKPSTSPLEASRNARWTMPPAK
ncbi:MAG: hypothetical protein ABIW76_00800 [Fibrobacteria bacterium]